MPTETYIANLSADGDGPPAEIRLRRWLKAGLRCHGVRCDGISAVPDPPTEWMAATNAPGKWRPRRRRPREKPP